MRGRPATDSVFILIWPPRGRGLGGDCSNPAHVGLIQCSPGVLTAWTHLARRRHNPSMPLDLTDAELATAATACRAMAYQEGERAKKMENPTMRPPRETNSRRFAVLAEKF